MGSGDELMCFPSATPAAIPRAPLPPSQSSAAVARRVQDVTRPNKPPMATILTSPLGDPNFGRNINRTVLTGVLT
jgi:hypothetical protein